MCVLTLHFPFHCHPHQHFRLFCQCNHQYKHQQAHLDANGNIRSNSSSEQTLPSWLSSASKTHKDLVFWFLPVYQFRWNCFWGACLRDSRLVSATIAYMRNLKWFVGVRKSLIWFSRYPFNQNGCSCPLIFHLMHICAKNSLKNIYIIFETTKKSL